MGVFTIFWYGSGQETIPKYLIQSSLFRHSYSLLFSSQYSNFLDTLYPAQLKNLKFSFVNLWFRATLMSLINYPDKFFQVFPVYPISTTTSSRPWSRPVQQPEEPCVESAWKSFTTGPALSSIFRLFTSQKAVSSVSTAPRLSGRKIIGLNISQNVMLKLTGSTSLSKNRFVYFLIEFSGQIFDLLFPFYIFDNW